METNIVKVNHQVLERDIEYYWSFRPSPTVGIVGEPGIGKTEIVQTVASKLGFEYIYYNPVRRNPNTITGVPFVKGDYAKWIPFETFKFLPEKTYVLHIDELTNAAPLVQSSLLNLVLERKAEDFTIPNNVHIVVSGNLSSHSRASFDFIDPLPSRLALYELQAPSAEDWSVWASKNGVHSLIISFILSNPALLIERDGNGVLKATPRGWARGGKIVRDSLQTDDMSRIVSSFVGERAGSAFRVWAKIRERLPTSLVDALYLKDGRYLEALKNKDVGVIFYTISSLSRSEIIASSETNFKATHRFIEVLPPEFQLITFRLFRTNERWLNRLKSNRESMDWIIKKVKEWNANVPL
jgi:hypothetical protein